MARAGAIVSPDAQKLAALWPAGNAEIEFRWAGTFDTTRDGLPRRAAESIDFPRTNNGSSRLGNKQASHRNQCSRGTLLRHWNKNAAVGRLPSAGSVRDDGCSRY
jgi:hypothetical protein